MAKTYLPNLPIGEEAREVDDFPDYYVTYTGRIFRYIAGKGYYELNQRMYKGYLRSTLMKDTKSYTIEIHRAVAIAWYGKHDKLTVNHKDENKSNNRADNLEWLTVRENNLHGTGRQRASIARQKYGSPEVLQLDLDGNLIKEWPSAIAIRRAYGYRYGSLRYAIQEYPREFKGYLWKRKHLKYQQKN